MYKKIKIMLSVLVISLQLFVAGAETRTNKAAVGVSFLIALNSSNTASYGLDFEYWFSPKFSLGVIGAGFVDNKNTYDNLNVSLQMKFSLIESEVINRFSSRLYVFCNAGYTGWSYVQTSYTDEDYKNPIYSKKSYHSFLGAAGLGIEFIVADHVSLPVNFGFAGKFPDEPALGFCLGTGLRYSF